MRCPKCEKDGVRHRVYEGGTTSTLMASPPPYWDEDGKYVVPPDPNIHTTNYHCSEGCRFQKRIQHGRETIIELDDPPPIQWNPDGSGFTVTIPNQKEH